LHGFKVVIIMNAKMIKKTSNHDQKHEEKAYQGRRCEAIVDSASTQAEQESCARVTRFLLCNS